MPKSVRLASVVALVVYLVVVARLVLSPSPVLANRAVVRSVEVADAFGVTVSLTVAELGLNALLVVPLALLGGLTFPRARPSTWVAAAFVGGLGVELAQLVGLSARTGSSRDVVANTLGALLGVLLLLAARRWLRCEARQRRASKPLSPPTNPIRTALIGAYAVYLAAVVYLVWSPTPGAPGRAVLSVVDLAASFGVVISSSVAERGLNVVMLVPFSLIGGLLLRRLSFSDWVVAGFVISSVIEIGQRIVLPTRSGSARDIVANTLGSLVGALLLATVLGLLAQRRTAGPVPHQKSGEPVPHDAGTMLR